MPWKFLPDSARPASHRGAPSAAAETASGDAPAKRPSTDTVFIARQAIFDAAERVVGYELFVRPSGLSPARAPASIGEDASLLIDTLNRFGVAHALADKTGFLQLGAATLASDLVELLPKERFVLAYPSNLLAEPELAARCAALRARGFRLARVCRQGDNDLHQAAAMANLIVYDLAAQPLQEIVRMDRAAKQQNVQRLVRNVNSRADFEGCKTFSFDFYQGNIFSRPESLAMNRLDPGRARVIEIFNLVSNRADVAEIENAFKHDVALCYSLLCYINSVGIGLQYKVSSIRDAVMLLGYDFLWRWLSLLIFAGVDLTAAQRLMLNTAVIRGRLMELLGQKNLSGRDGNLLFIVGTFSLLDALLGVPLQEVTTRLQLPQEVAQALASRTGKYAPYLELALAFETNNLARAERLCAELGIELGSASKAHLAAIEWAGVLAK